MMSIEADESVNIERERLLIEHPACVQDPTWYALAREATTALNGLYQRIGARHLDAD